MIELEGKNANKAILSCQNHSYFKKKISKMHKIETILFGIAIIIFGIASALISLLTNWGFFAPLAIFAPFVGLAVAVIGIFDRGYDKDKGQQENNESQED